MSARNLVLVLLVLNLGLADADLLTSLAPVTAEPPADESISQTRIRGSEVIYLWATEPGEEIRLTVQSVRIGRYEDEVRVTLPVAPGAEPRVEAIPVTEQRKLAFEAPAAGPQRVEVFTGSNAAVVTPQNRWLAMEASAANSLHCISRVDKLFFYVPRDTESFRIWAQGAGTEENVCLRVFDPSGEERGEARVIGGATEAVAVAVPTGMSGKIWHFTAGGVPGVKGVFEDCYLWLSPELPPVVSTSAGGLLVPFASGLVQRPRYLGEGADRAIKIGLNVPASEGQSLQLRLMGKTNRFMTVTKTPTTKVPASIVLPAGSSEGEYELTVRLEEGERVVAETSTPVMLAQSVLYVGGYQPLLEVQLHPKEQGLRTPKGWVRLNLEGGSEQWAAEAVLLRTENHEPPGGPTASVAARQDMKALGLEKADLNTPEELSDGHYQWLVIARDKDGAPIAWGRAHFLLKGDKLFEERRPSPSPPLGAIPEGQLVVLFVPEAAEAIPYNACPSRAELEREISIFAAKDEYEPATLGLLAMKDLGEVSVSVTDLRDDADHTIPADAVDVRIARHWPQRISWRTTTYKIVPEMLEHRESFAMRQTQIVQAWLTAHVPADAPPGEYAGEVVVSADGKRLTKPFKLRVLPFTLPIPEGRDWGLYSDGSRWNRMPDSQVAAEMADFVAHGITNLMMYPPVHTEAKYENGKLILDTSRFERYMNMAMAAGIRAPTVISMQALAGVVKQLTGKKVGDPEFDRVYKEYTAAIEGLAKERNWGECVYHAVDEPHAGSPRAKEVVHLLSLVKELKVPTFTTVTDPNLAQGDLNPFLDVRCYASGRVLGGADICAQRRAETLESGDRFWYYGSGCYTGQDGNVIANRYVTGYAYWKSKATGEWSWTFMRAKDDIYDDFDGERHGEYKEACIAYPSTDAGAATPTLQWEGIREGIDDYKYLWLAVQEAAKRGEAEGRKMQEQLDELVEKEVPWRGRGGFTCAKAQELRRQVAEIIAGGEGSD